MVAAKTALRSSMKVDLAHLTVVDTLQFLPMELVAQHTVAFGGVVPHEMHVCSRSCGWRMSLRQAVTSFWWWFVDFDMRKLTNQLGAEAVVWIPLP